MKKIMLLVILLLLLLELMALEFTYADNCKQTIKEIKERIKTLSDIMRKKADK